MNIGELAKKYGLSRSALLYYDSINLLKPSGRSRSNYRQYTREDQDRLEKICLYRQMGLSMRSVARILDSPGGRTGDILEKRLLELGREIVRLREQQRVIISMLNNESLRERFPVMDKAGWISLLRAAGLDEEGMDKWHREFEKMAPASHQEFLEGLGIPEEEIALIRQSSRG